MFNVSGIETLGQEQTIPAITETTYYPQTLCILLLILMFEPELLVQALGSYLAHQSEVQLLIALRRPFSP